MNNMQLTIESSTTSMDLNDHQTGIYLVPELDGMTGLPEIRTSSGVNAGYDGGWTSAQNYDARLITIRGVIAHPVVSTVETIRRQLVSLVGQGRKEALTLRLTTEAGNVYTVFVRTIACTMALQRVLTSQEFQIQFRADDPLIYDDGASSGTAGILRVQRALGGFEINFNLPLFIGGGSTGTPIENGGSETVYPIINLYGPLHSPTVINSTTNQQMQILADLACENNWQTPATTSGSSFQITGIEGAPLTLTELKGNATQNGTPTPTAPVAVNTTTGENVVKITGKNLWDSETAVAYSNNSATFITGEWLQFSTGGNQLKYPLYISSGTSVVLTATVRSLVTAQNVVGFQLVNSDGTTTNLGTAQVLTDTDEHAFIASGTATKEVVAIRSRNTSAKDTQFKLNTIQLELGTTATTYEPYKGQEFEVNLGKNLLPIASTTRTDTHNGITITLSDDGLITLDGTATSSMWPDLIYGIQNNTTTHTSCYLYYGQSDVVFSAKVVGGTKTTSAGGITIVYNDTETHATIPFSDMTQQKTTSATNGINRAYIYIANGSVFNNYSFYLQCEKGSTATSYAPYFPPIELCKLGTYQDYIYKDGDDWKVHKAISKVMVDGTIGAISNPSANRFNIDNLITNYEKRENSQLALCDRYITIGQAYNNAQFNTLASNYECCIDLGCGAANVVRFKNTRISTSSDFAAALEANPLTLYYALATPTTTEITNQTLIDQLNFIANLYGGTNNIMLVGTGAQGEIGVEYMTENDIRRDVAVVDSQARTITINGSDAYHLKADGSEFITIAPGTNDMTLTSAQTSDEGYAEIKYKQGYLSI